MQVAANVGGRTEPHYLISYGSGTPEANGIYVRMPGTSDVERPNGAAMYYCSAGYTISLELVGGTSGYILGKVRACMCRCTAAAVRGAARETERVRERQRGRELCGI